MEGKGIDGSSREFNQVFQSVLLVELTTILF